MRFRKCFAIFVFTVFVIRLLSVQSLGATGTREDRESTPIVVRATHVNAPDHPVGQGLELFKQLVEERTGGAIQVNTYHQAALGNAREIIEGTQLNTIQFGSTNTAELEAFAPEFDIFSTPFLFRNIDHIEKAINSELTNVLAEKMRDLDLEFFGFSSSGARHIYTNRPVESVDDLRGMTIRAMSVPTIIGYLEAVGARPVPMGFGDVYGALLTGTIDGAESNIISWYRMNHFEGAPYIAMINYMDSGNAYFGSSEFMDSLSADHRRIVREAYQEAIAGINEGFRLQQEQIEREIAPTLRNTALTYPDLQPFVEAARRVWENNPPTLGLKWVEFVRELQ